ncbi:MAG: energy transducer TonB [Terracidiphilus sp.]
MPIDEAPIDVKEPDRQIEPSRSVEIPPVVVRGSRWVDYDTHELLEMISELEDERRWARLREGIWIAILFHALLFTAALLLPKYFKGPPIVESDIALKEHKEFTYLDSPKFEPKVEIKPVPIKPPQIDQKTLEEMKKDSPPASESAPAPATVAPTPSPIPPSQQSQSPIEAPPPAAVPARPSFAMNSENPADALRDAMKNAARDHGGGTGNLPSHGGLSMHPGAGTGGVQILSDTQGVDFNNWLIHWHRETERTWDPLIPDEVNPPISKSGQLMIRFKVLPNGRLMEGSMVLEGSSGDVALDRAAWGALTGSNYPPLPRDFHGPYLELRAWFLYNMDPQQQ